jgi:methylenetetrahydrofolate dehydrogenase (NADP+) / methenyltetrahydrofolate cyclohydrolase
MQSKNIDGKALAKEIRRKLKNDVGQMVDRGVTPGLAVVLVGDDPASAVYVRNKTRACKRAGIAHFDHVLPADTTESDLLALLQKLNADDAVDGILVQLPLPAHLDEAKLLSSIDPVKDADGFHPINLGRLFSGLAGSVPCTPLGIIELLKHADTPLKGANALVVGRSTIVGKPVAHLLLAEHCTVTIAHSRTKNLAQVVAQADIVVAAVGRPELIKGEWIKEGATVIDVGINRVDDKLVGDVEFDQAALRARAITPVPGGVGPMTIAMLLSNTVKSARRRLPA